MEEIRTIKPIVLKGHDRPITEIVFNREGDLLFSASKGTNPTVWDSKTGERLGTYDITAISGAVSSIDVNFNSTRLLTACRDMTTRLWDVRTGEELYVWKQAAPVRYVSWALGDKFFLTVGDAVLGKPATVSLFRMEEKVQDLSPEPFLVINNEQKKLRHAEFGPLNESIYATREDGYVIVYDTETGEIKKQFKAHDKEITAFKFSQDKLFFVTGSKDSTCKMWDTRTYELLKTYETGRPVYEVAISPNTLHLLVAIGQDVATVTTSGADASQFRVRVFHLVYEQEIASIPGHFAPVNSLAFSPDGKIFASGGEDGYVRVHHLGESLTAGLSDEVVFSILE